MFNKIGCLAFKDDVSIFKRFERKQFDRINLYRFSVKTDRNIINDKNIFYYKVSEDI